MKKFVLLAMFLVLVLALSACGCKHETWLAADCVTPKTCAECGETDGEPLGHTWKDADCETPKTCTVCTQTEGAALGHSWTVADCETPKTCQTCQLTEGDALGHDWAEATTEAPKTCNACGKTEGERIITDPRFTTANNQQLFGLWKAELSESIPGSDIAITMYIYMDFHNDGTMKLKMELKDPEAFMDAMIQSTIEATYADMAAAGYNKESANAAFEDVYGMTIEAYVTEIMASMDLNEMLGIMDAVSYVYYTEDDQLYSGISWNMDMTAETFRMEDGVLFLFENGTAIPTAFYPVEEIQE